mmetsp:Transcript_27343/g.35500  ORF Transcript_27343/g.35500 Transcript_27343/m.35500 type:complete len:84 (+) Transcript_27343:4999-5250(+)
MKRHQFLQIIFFKSVTCSEKTVCALLVFLLFPSQVISNHLKKKKKKFVCVMSLNHGDFNVKVPCTLQSLIESYKFIVHIDIYS